LTDKIWLAADGSLQLPEDYRRRLNLKPGDAFVFSETDGGISIRPVDSPLKKVYVEPTALCNLNCPACIRSSWTDEAGQMPIALFKRLVSELKTIPTVETVAFWGFGEPLLHPDIIEMVSLAKSIGAKTELITNGLLLDQNMSEALVSAGLDTIVVSIDGTSPESYARARSGASFQDVYKNIQYLNRWRFLSTDTIPFLQDAKPEIGIEFVATRKNVAELPNLPKLALSIGASFVIVTNILPYAETFSKDILYRCSTGDRSGYSRTTWFPELSLASMDLQGQNVDALTGLLKHVHWLKPPVKFARPAGEWCPFVNEGALAVSWDGSLSPCVALMHSYTCYVIGRKKSIRRYNIGNLMTDSIRKIWCDAEYVNFRTRVLSFDFSPCLRCSGCELSESNEEDCFGNPFPTCGDCLWAGGFVLCP